MGRYSSKTFLKTSKINDTYWRHSWFLSEGLLDAVDKDCDEEIFRCLKNPNLFTGKA